MSNHSEIQELIPVYVLGALEPDEAELVEAHAATCASCAASLDELRPVSAALAFAVPAQRPPEDLKARTLEHVFLSGRPSGPPPLKERRTRALRPPETRLPWRLGPVLAGAALVLSLLAIGWGVFEDQTLHNQLAAQNDLLVVMAYSQGNAQDIHGTEAAPLAEGKLFADKDSNLAALISINLPRTGPNDVYQVWLIAGNGQRVSGGTFQTDANGSGWLIVRAPSPLASYAQVGVTREPFGGSTAPSSPPLLKADLTLQ